MHWTLWAVFGLVAIAVGLAVAYRRVVPSDEQVATRVAAAAGHVLGVKVNVRTAHLQLWPQAEVVLEEVATAQPQPISVKRVAVQLGRRELLRHRTRIRQLEIDGMVVPQLSLQELHLAPRAASDALSVEWLHVRGLTWITPRGKPLELEGSAAFSQGWRPRRAELMRSGVAPPARLILAQDGADRWRVQLQIGGGAADGQIALQTGQDGRLQLSGQLAPSQIDVARALEAFKARSPVRGKASGQTQFFASGRNLTELLVALHSRTDFSMSPATLLHIDVDKAIRSLGKDRAGQTPLRSLSGRMETQNTPDGMVIRYSGLQAIGETFSAQGGGTIANRHVQGQMTVDLAGGMRGVPVKVSGPLSEPQVSVPTTTAAGAAAGAAVGTAVLPGIGTALGAGIGGALGQMLGGKHK